LTEVESPARQLQALGVVRFTLIAGNELLNATFNNISVILWWSVLLMEETGGPGENH
jgi:hypothetical protein